MDNKNGSWKYLHEHWTLPLKEEKEKMLIETLDGDYLGLIGNNKVVLLSSSELVKNNKTKDTLAQKALFRIAFSMILGCKELEIQPSCVRSLCSGLQYWLRFDIYDYCPYTAIPYRVSTGPEQGFPCVVFPHREKPVFSS